MPQNEASPGGPLLQCILEWRIDGAVDGTAVAPGVEAFNNAFVQRVTPPDQIFVIDVEGAVGVFNPDGSGERGSYADRYIQWIRIVPATFPVAAGFVLAVGDANGIVPSLGVLLPFDEIFTGPFPPPAFYRAAMNFVPQGGAVIIQGLPAPPPGLRHVIQMGVRAATLVDEDAELEKASCCLFDPG